MVGFSGGVAFGRGLELGGKGCAFADVPVTC